MDKYCLVVNGNSYFSPFDHLGLKLINDASILDSNPNEVGLVVFTGGEDVSPNLYGHTNVSSWCNVARDNEESYIFRKTVKLNIPIAGICRGAQLICAMAGGHIVQDITNHGVNHYLRFVDDDGIEKISPEKVTSTHHQMQYPWPIGEENFEILAWSPSPISQHYYYADVKIPRTIASDKFKIEPDVVFYKNINALAIQYHPEWMSRDSWGFKFAQRTISNKISHLIAAQV